MDKIATITDAQWDRLREIRDEWTAVGLSTQRCDRDAGAAAIRRAYECVGLAPPRFVVWFDDPWQCALAQGMLLASGQVEGQVEGQVGDQVRGQVRGQVEGQVEGQVAGQVAAQVGDQVEGQVWAQVGDQVADQVWAQVAGQVAGQVAAQVRDQVAGQVWAQVGDQVADQVWAQVAGQVAGQVWDQVRVAQTWHRYVGGGDWAHWAAWVEAMRHIGVTGLDIADGRIAASKHTWWWWPLTDIAIVCDRPTSIVGEQIAPAGWGSHRLHNPTGPAVEFASGWAIWAWHGLRVPEWVITDPTPERIAAEANIEIRRAAIESRGWDRYVVEAGLTVIDHDPDPLQGTLHAAPDDLFVGGANVLVVVNGTPAVDGTPQRYGLTVPADCRTVARAQAWIAGCTEPLVLARRT